MNLKYFSGFQFFLWILEAFLDYENFFSIFKVFSRRQVSATIACSNLMKCNDKELKVWLKLTTRYHSLYQSLPSFGLFVVTRCHLPLHSSVSVDVSFVCFYLFIFFKSYLNFFYDTIDIYNNSLYWFILMSLLCS